MPSTIWDTWIFHHPKYNHHTIDFSLCTTPKDLLSTVQAAYDTLPPPIHIVGWSLGAMLALEVAAQDIDTIQSLHLISPTDRFIRNTTSPYGWDLRILQRMKQQLQIHPQEVISAFDQQLFSPSEKEKKMDVLWKKTFRKEKPNPAPLIAGLDYLIQFDALPFLQNIHIPVYLLTGEHDRICPVKGAENLVNHLKDSHLTILPKIGHIPFWTNPDIFGSWIREHLN